MIGTPVSATLWIVHYRFRNVDAPLVQLASSKPPEHVAGELKVLTADPTGSDLCDVAAREVLGVKLRPEHEFRLEHVHRVCDVCGLALVGERPE